MFQFLHLPQIIVDLGLWKQHVVAVLAHHLQDQDQVLEITYVVDRQI